MNLSPDTDKSEKIVARRGSRTLNVSELEAHLAACVRLQNVGVLLGAGASKDLSGKTMEDIRQDLQSESNRSIKWLRAKQFIPEKAEAELDVEKLISALEVARVEWTRAQRAGKLRNLCRARADVLRFVIRAAILREEWWDNPQNLGLDSVALADHRRLLHKLTAARQPGQPSPWVFTLNYGLAVEWAAEAIGLKVTNGFEGLHHRTFSPHNFDLDNRNVLARGEARFGTYSIYLAKLHGSLSWRQTQDHDFEECSTTALWPAVREFLNGDGTDIPVNLIYPEAAKHIETVGFVFGELMRRFTEFLSKPQSCLIVNGYSFADAHVNRVLMTALQNPTLQLVIYAPGACFAERDLNTDECGKWLR